MLIKSNKNKVYFYTGLLLAISEIIKQVTLTTYYGHYVWWNYPFQLCSIAMYLCLLLPFVRIRKLYHAMETFLMTFSLMGGICAFFDTTGMHYRIPWLTLHSYLWHIVLIGLGIYAGLNSEIWKSAEEENGKINIPVSDTTIDNGKINILVSDTLYLLCAAIAEIINLTFDRYGEINMFYINPHYQMSQIVFGQIAEKTSNTCSIILYICCSIIGASILFTIWKLLSRKHRERGGSDPIYGSRQERRSVLD